jgi:hypothetical protein
VITVVVNGVTVPKVVGCGCNRKTLAQRISCPGDYVVYNNECVSQCPPGFADIKDVDGNIVSLYCMAPCPLKKANSNERWPFSGGLCVKDYTSRTAHSSSLHSPDIPVDGLPSTMASFLSSRESSINSRYRYGQSISDSLGSSPLGNPFAVLVGDSWENLFSAPDKIVFLIILILVLIYAGPPLLPLIGKGLGYIFSGLGLGLGSVAGGVGKVTGSTLSLTADLERSAGLAAQKRSVEKLAQANDNLKKSLDSIQ